MKIKKEYIEWNKLRKQRKTEENWINKRRKKNEIWKKERKNSVREEIEFFFFSFLLLSVGG